MVRSGLVSISVGYPMPLQIILKNTQNVDTPSPFQQMLQLEASEINSVLPSSTPQVASDFHNIRFKYNYSYIPAWLESINNGVATIWVNIPVSIPANSSITVDMEVDPSLNFDGVYWGEAPQLSPTYGEYDNGASVFNFYDNFAGTSLNTTKWGIYLSSGESYTVNNGFIGSGTGYAFIMSKNAYNPQQYVADAYGYATSTAIEHAGNWGWAGNQANAGAGSSYQYFVNTYNNAYYSGIWTGSDWYELSFLGTGSTTSDFVMSIYTTTSAVVASINYGSWISNSTNFVASTGLSAGFQWNAGPFYVQWFRLRAIPPNGVMPSVEVIA